MDWERYKKKIARTCRHFKHKKWIEKESERESERNKSMSTIYQFVIYDHFLNTRCGVCKSVHLCVRMCRMKILKIVHGQNVINVT